MTNLIFLTGLKSSGKTTIGKLLSEKTNIPFFDLDQKILEMNPQYDSCRSLYIAEGNESFRQKELSAFEDLCSALPLQAIIALGGGACETSGLLKKASELGRLIYLKTDEETLFKRMEAQGLPPYLGQGAKASFHALWQKRNQAYSFFANFVLQLTDYSIEQTMSILHQFIFSQY